MTCLTNWALSFAFVALVPSGSLLFFHVRDLPFSAKLAHLWFACFAIAAATIYAVRSISITHHASEA